MSVNWRGQCHISKVCFQNFVPSPRPFCHNLTKIRYDLFHKPYFTQTLIYNIWSFNFFHIWTFWFTVVVYNIHQNEICMSKDYWFGNYCAMLSDFWKLLLYQKKSRNLVRLCIMDKVFYHRVSNFEITIDFKHNWTSFDHLLTCHFKRKQSNSVPSLIRVHYWLLL